MRSLIIIFCLLVTNAYAEVPNDRWLYSQFQEAFNPEDYRGHILNSLLNDYPGYKDILLDALQKSAAEKSIKISSRQLAKQPIVYLDLKPDPDVSKTDVCTSFPALYRQEKNARYHLCVSTRRLDLASFLARHEIVGEQIVKDLLTQAKQDNLGIDKTQLLERRITYLGLRARTTPRDDELCTQVKVPHHAREKTKQLSVYPIDSFDICVNK